MQHEIRNDASPAPSYFEANRRWLVPLLSTIAVVGSTSYSAMLASASPMQMPMWLVQLVAAIGGSAVALGALLTDTVSGRLITWIALVGGGGLLFGLVLRGLVGG